MVATWVLHIAFVHLALGAAGLAVWAFHRRASGGYWERLSMAMTKAAKVGVSLLIVLGVAPLLFTQVIYDPQWYASNLLSAAWAITFIFTLIIGYCLWFVFYQANHAGAKRHVGLYAWLALALFFLDGLIMHALSYQALLPGEWLQWYAPDGVVDTSGSRLHAIQWPRFLFIMGLSVPAVGVLLIAYAHYFSGRPDREAAYLDFARGLGRKLAAWGFAASALLMLAWQVVQPQELGLLTHPVGWLLLLALEGMAFWMWRLKERTHGYAPAAAALAVLLLLAIWRELVRMAHLAPFGYDISTYPVRVDWPSLLLFASTLVGVGGLVAGFYLTLLYRAGRVQGHYVADATVARLGTAAVAVVIAWTAIFFAYGIVIWVHNNFV